jgi:hypothetical protein
MGHSIYPLLPRGEHETFWHRFINELQMLLHQSPVNQKRDDLGMDRISVFWPWGEGEFSISAARQRVKVIADDLHGAGLSILMGADLISLDQLTSVLFQLDEERVIIYSDTGSEGVEDLQFLETRVFSPLVSAWKKGRLKRINLSIADQSFKLNSRRFWQGLVRC